MQVMTVQDTTAAPAATIDNTKLERWMSQRAAAAGVTTDAQLATAMDNLFQAATAGAQPLTQAARVFLADFFKSFAHLG